MTELALTTPNGVSVVFEARDGTNDHNVVFSICAADEYGLRGTTTLEGWALDLGAHVGGVSICLALDNPNLRDVVAVEPVPENAELIRRHAARNGVRDRLSVLELAVGAPGDRVTMRYGFRHGTEIDHHAWIGNSSNVYQDPPVEDHDELEVGCLDLLALREAHGSAPSFVKVDCEGGEWPALEQLVALGSPVVIGEWHPVLGHQSADELVAAFVAAGYSVQLDGPDGGPGLFRATL